jgi:predicted RecB family nuclease
MIEGGLEYLLGVVYQENGHLVFKDWWAHDRSHEKASFEAFIDWAYGRWKHDPSMHGYHYPAYETTALKRLMCRYASRESEIDELLRNHVFVDLYTVVCQALLIGKPSYSLKNVEHPFFAEA